MDFPWRSNAEIIHLSLKRRELDNGIILDFHFDDLLDNLLKAWCRLNQGNIKARSDRNRAARLGKRCPKEEFKRPEREDILRAIEIPGKIYGPWRQGKNKPQRMHGPPQNR